MNRNEPKKSVKKRSILTSIKDGNQDTACSKDSRTAAYENKDPEGF